MFSRKIKGRMNPWRNAKIPVGLKAFAHLLDAPVAWQVGFQDAATFFEKCDEWDGILRLDLPCVGMEQNFRNQRVRGEVFVKTHYNTIDVFSGNLSDF